VVHPFYEFNNKDEKTTDNNWIRVLGFLYMSTIYETNSFSFLHLWLPIQPLNHCLHFSALYLFKNSINITLSLGPKRENKHPNKFNILIQILFSLIFLLFNKLFFLLYLFTLPENHEIETNF